MYKKLFRPIEIIIYITLILLLVGIITLVISSIILGVRANSDDTLKTDSQESVTEKSSVTEPIKQFYYNVTAEERYLLAKIAHAEASICSQECQEAVISVIFNRLESGKWRRDMNNDGIITIYDIIYYPNAFTPATNGAIDKWEPTSKDYAAVDTVLQNGPTVPTYVRYFRASYDFSWDGYKNYKTIDNVYFGYFEDWQEGAW